MTKPARIGRAKESPAEPRDVEGLPPPHDLDAEAATISSILIDPSAIDECVDFLEVDHFYSESHRRIYETCLELRGEQCAIDVVSVGSRLKLRDRIQQVGGMGYLTDILNAAPAVQNVVTYAKIVFDLWRVRQTILHCQMTASLGYVDYGSAEQYLIAAERKMIELASSVDTRRTEPIAAIARRAYDTIAESQSKNTFPGVPTGYDEYDDLTTGLHPGDVTLIGARPGMGKTGFALGVSVNVASAPPPLFGDEASEGERSLNGVGFFSLEMPREQLVTRAMSIESAVNFSALRRMRLNPEEWNRLADGCRRLAPMPIFIDDTPGLHISRLRAMVRRLKAKVNRIGRDHRGVAVGATVRLVLVVIDYLQLLSAKADDIRGREQEVAVIAKELKIMAKQERVHVMALAQLSRDIEKRTGPKRPGLSDLRESGELEQSADNVTFLYRPEYYGESVLAGEEGKTELIVAKQRNGPTGVKAIRYVPQYTRFQNF